MTIFIVLVGLSIVGIGVSLWLLKKENDAIVPTLPKLDLKEGPELISPGTESTAQKAEGPPAPSRKSPLSLFSGILQKIQFGKKPPPEEEALAPPPLPSLKDYLAEETIPLIKRPATGTASITTQDKEETSKESLVSSTEEKAIEKEIHLSDQLNELKEKYQNLEKLFNEKSTALAKTEESLDNELKNRKEFNKLKDLLEKELKESKDKARDAQVELNSSRAEGESYKKRINQLEEKVTKLEKNILEKEQEIANLLKRPTPQKTAEASVPSEETTAEKAPEQEKPEPLERPPQKEGPPPDTQEQDNPPSPDIQTGEGQEDAGPPLNAEKTDPPTEFLKLQPDILSEPPVQESNDQPKEKE